MTDQPLRMIRGRYELHEPLGHGGIGVVYRAIDRMFNTALALKTFKVTPKAGVDVDALRLGFAREFRLLATLRHPNIISVLDYGFDDARQPYYTMELLEDAQTILKVGKPASIMARVDLLTQLLQALVYLHRRGILHRDLKPSNILVVANDFDETPTTRANAERVGQVRLLDFGLAAVRGQDDAQNTLVAGTLFYLAPEVLGGAAHSEASDLYAVGLIAYELFAGVYPFRLESMSRMITTLRTAQPDFDALDAPPTVRAVMARLLAKDPAARYQDAGEVIEALSAAVGMAPPPESIAIRESFLQSAQLVGRESELAQLTAALEEAMRGQGSVWLIGGESGVGKSRLLDELRAVALVSGALVTRGQAVPDATLNHYVWRRVVRRLALNAPPDDADAAVLAQIIPDLDAVIERDVPAATQTSDMQARIAAAFERLVRAQPEPVVILLEDIEWMRQESTGLLRRLIELAAGLPLLIVGTYSSDENPNLPVILPRARVLTLQRFNTDQIAAVAESMLGAVGRAPRIVRFLERESEGNAFFLVEVVRALAAAAGERGRVGMLPLPDHVMTDGVREALARRLGRVPAASVPMLNAAAIAGRTLNLQLLRQLDADFAWREWLVELADAGILELRDGQWRFAHDRLRFAVIDGLRDDERRALHRALAEAMEAITDDDSQTAFLVYHWAHAGDLERESLYAERSGALALAGSVFGEAVRWYERALALYDGRDDRGMWLRLRLGGAYVGVNRYADAERVLHEGLALAQVRDDAEAILFATHLLARVDFDRGRATEAQRRFNRVLAHYRAANHVEGVVQVLVSLGLLAFEYSDAPADAERLWQEAAQLARRSGYRFGEGRALHGLGVVALERGDLAAAERVSGEAFALADADGDQSGVALALLDVGKTQRLRGAHAEAQATLAQAVGVSRETGWRVGEALALAEAAAAAYALGDVRGGSLLSRDTLTLTLALETSVLLYTVLLTVGDALYGAGLLHDALLVYAFTAAHAGNVRRARSRASEAVAALQPQFAPPEFDAICGQAAALAPDGLLQILSQAG